MRLLLLLALLTLGCAAASPAAAPRLRWYSGGATQRLLAGASPLLEVLAKPAYSATLWRVDGGALAWDRRGSVDTFAIRQSGERAREVTFSADVRILEGDVAGLVLRADPGGPACFAVLLGAQSKLLRIAYLPWPGRDLLAVPYPVERDRPYRLEVTCRDTGAGARLEIQIDGKPVAQLTSAMHQPPGDYLGVMCNNSRARFDHLEARAGGPGGRLLFRDEFETDDLSDYAATGLPFTVSRREDTLALTLKLPEDGAGLGAIAQLRHGMASPRHVWVPHVTPEPGYVIGDHALRSPAIVLRKRRGGG